MFKSNNLLILFSLISLYLKILQNLQYSNNTNLNFQPYLQFKILTTQTNHPHPILNAKKHNITSVSIGFHHLCYI